MYYFSSRLFRLCREVEPAEVEVVEEIINMYLLMHFSRMNLSLKWKKMIFRHPKKANTDKADT